MENPILEELKTKKLDYSAYGRLPIVEDVYLLEEKNEKLKKNRALLEQYKKLKYIQKNLRLLDKYIQTNKGETLQDWLVLDKSGMSENVISKIGKHNNETGGISSYFFNLQNFYDAEEAIYDKMEADCKVPEDIEKAIPSMRKERDSKRSNRGVTRKLLIRDMKADNKGYILVEMEEPSVVGEEPVLLNATGDSSAVDPESTSTDAKTTEVKNEDASKLNTDTGGLEKKIKSNINIWIAGTLIVVIGVGVYVGLKSEK